MKRWKAGDWFGAVVFALLLGARMAQAAQGQAMALPLAGQAGLAAFLMLARKPEQGSVSLRRKLLAWLGALLPFALRVGNAPTGWMLVSLVGVGISLWGLASLGRSFGIAPADRGLVTGGAYRLVRHPMYAGELLSFLAVVLADPLVWNVFLFFVILLVFILRIGWEEEILNGYAAYGQRVRWRMLPGVW